eukprot:8150134-Alexandrium_andersonii.AAC.1
MADAVSGTPEAALHLFSVMAGLSSNNAPAGGRGSPGQDGWQVPNLPPGGGGMAPGAAGAWLL